MISVLCMMAISAALCVSARREEAQQKVLSAAAVRGAAQAHGTPPQPNLDTLLPQNVEQDLSQPLSHYFISSSHNSYLDGGQLLGTTSTGAIERLLRLGFKVIEYDVYDGPDGPEVKHGPAPTGKFLFIDGIKTIKQWAFNPKNERYSDLPLILTLEDHCSPKGQKTLAEILKTELGDMLYVPPNPRPRQFPSPDELKGKVVIRDKPGVVLAVEGEDGNVVYPTEEGQRLAAAWTEDTAELSPEGLKRLEKLAKAKAKQNEKDEEDENDDKDEGEEEEDELKGLWMDDVEDIPMPSMALMQGQSQAVRGSASATAGTSVESSTHAESRKHKNKPPMVEELKALVAIPNQKKKKGSWELGDRPVSHSFNNKKILKLAVKYPEEIIAYAREHLIRVYPHALAIMSGNYDPVELWLLGIQIIAMNAQNFRTGHSTNAKGVQATQGFFLGTGGYQLKPDYLLDSSKMLEGFTFKGENLAVRSKRTVKILALHGLDLESLGSKVKRTQVLARLHGCRTDKTKWKSPQASVKNGVATFKDNSKTLDLRVPEVATLTFEVYSYSAVGAVFNRFGLGRGTKVAYFSFPLGRGQDGKHTVRLSTPDSFDSKAASVTFELESEEEDPPIEPIGAVADLNV